MKHPANGRWRVALQRWSVLVLLALPGSVRADETGSAALATVRRALARADQVRLTEWAYTVTAVTDGRKTVERHDPGKGRTQRWQLLLADGKEPSEKERKKHAEERRRRGGGMANRKLGDLLDPDSLKVESQDARQIRCTFRLKVHDEDTRFVLEKLRGTLTVLPESASLAAVEVTNTERISKPGLLALNELRIQAQYRPDPVRGDPVLHTCSSRIRGRVLLVKSINSDTQITYSDHRWIGPGADAGKSPPAKPTASPYPKLPTHKM